MIVIRRYDFSRKPNLYAECGKMAGVQPLPSPKPGWAPLTQKQGWILGGKSLSIRTGQPTPRQGQWASPCPQPEAGRKYQVSSSLSPDPPEIKEGARTCWPHPAPPPPKMSSQRCHNPTPGQIPCLGPGGHFKDHQRGAG